MAFRIYAPYPGYETCVILRDPELSNSIDSGQHKTVDRSVENDLYVLLKTSDQIWSITFEIPYTQAAELMTFILNHYQQPMRFDLLGISYFGTIVNDPVTFTFGIDDWCSVSLDLAIGGIM